MCGRYALYSNEIVNYKFKKKIKKNYNISPNQRVVVINKEFNVIKMNWGIRPIWKKILVINARSETLTKKFNNCQRCVFIADGYYEWISKESGKTPFYHFVEDDLLYFAGIYDDSGCSIVTKKSSGNLSKIHLRQPFLIKEKQIESWIKNKDEELFFDNIINFHKVSLLVNKTWNNFPDLIKEENEHSEISFKNKI